MGIRACAILRFGERNFCFWGVWVGLAFREIHSIERYGLCASVLKKQIHGNSLQGSKDFRCCDLVN